MSGAIEVFILPPEPSGQQVELIDGHRQGRAAHAGGCTIRTLKERDLPMILGVTTLLAPFVRQLSEDVVDDKFRAA
jgi:hypothetical protein